MKVGTHLPTERNDIIERGNWPQMGTVLREFIQIICFTLWAVSRAGWVATRCKSLLSC